MRSFSSFTAVAIGNEDAVVVGTERNTMLWDERGISAADGLVYTRFEVE